MKQAIHLILSLLVLILIAITCTEEPAGPDISDDLKPKGTITGWVYDMWNRPLKDVLVSVNADSADAGVSTVTGQFIVGNVREGTYILRFTHRDYDDNPTCTVAVSLGVDDTVKTPVQLSYAYYILQGNVTVNGSAQAGAGVAIADYTEGALTGPGGSFILRKVPKNDSLTLVCAYGAISTQVTKITGCLANDTNNLGTIDLTLTGATISGTVYDHNGIPKQNMTVTAVGGGLKTTADQNGFYLLRNVPANEDGIIVMVNEDGYVGAAIGFFANENAYISGCDIHLYPEPEIVNGMKLIVCDVYVPSTALSVVPRVYPTTEVNTEIAVYSWNIGGAVCTTSVPSTAVSVAQLTAAATLVQVQAVNAQGNLSDLMSFYIYLTGIAPVIDSISVSADKITWLPAISIQEGSFAYFHVEVTDLFGGLATMTWNFGDGSSWAAPDSNPCIGHLYDTAGVYAAIFQAVDTDGNPAADTVSVTVVKPVLAKPVLLSPDSGAVIKVPKDSVTFSWQPVTGAGIVYNVYMAWQNTIPSEQNIVGTALTVTSCKVPVDSARTYYWRVKAVRAADSAYAWSAIHCFTVYTNSSDIAPVFISRPEDMTDTMLLSKVYIDTLKAMDENGDQIYFSFIDSVDSMKLTGNILSFKPTRDNNGLRHVSVKVADGTGLFDTLAWDIYINILPDLQPPAYVSPPDNDTNKTLIDSVSLLWISAGSGITYNILWDVVDTPVAYAAKGIDTTVYRAAVDSGKTYFWQIEALRLSDSAYARGEIRKYTGRNYNSNTGLVADWQFEGNAFDMTGNGHNGSVFEADYAKGRYGSASQAVVFDGVDDYVEVPHSMDLNLSPEFTVSLWVYQRQFSVTQYLMSKYSSNSGFHIQTNPNSLVILYLQLVGVTSTITTSALSLQSWALVTFTYDGRKLKSYLNGEYQNYKDLIDAALPCTTTTSLLIGSDKTVTSSYVYNGRLDDIRVYNRALTDFEIAAVYNEWTNANHVPEFSGTMKDTAVLGVRYIDTLRVIDTDGDDLRYSLLTGPANVTLTDTIISASFQFNETGAKDISVTVEDGRGGKDTLAWQVHVVSKIQHNDKGMVLIPSGGKTFMMGQVGISGAVPVHPVTFTKDFWMDSTEVTQKDYDSLMKAYYPAYTDSTNPDWSGFGTGDKYPAYYVNWYDVVLYCNARSKRDGLDTVYAYTVITGTPGNGCTLTGILINYTRNGYRLPTEAEWEFACRGGTLTDYYWGNDGNLAGYYSWYSANAGGQTREAALLVPNPFGLYDIIGNVTDLCGDWYGVYSSGQQTDPTGLVSGSSRVHRGASWSSLSAALSASRGSVAPNQLSCNIGFRVVCPAQ